MNSVLIETVNLDETENSGEPADMFIQKIVKYGKIIQHEECTDVIIIQILFILLKHICKMVTYLCH